MIPRVPKPRRQTFVQETCHAIVDHIRHSGASLTRNGEGAWLPPERELAVRLGVSRTVIREATKRLEMQGLLEAHHGKGLKVITQLHRSLSESVRLDVTDPEERLRQLSETRIAMAPESARLAALRAKDADIAALRRIQDRLKRAPDLGAAADADTDFHHHLAIAGGNSIIALLLRSLADLSRESRLRPISTTGVERAHEHHERILAAVAAVAAGDAEEAAKEMRYHVTEAAIDFAEASDENIP